MSTQLQDECVSREELCAMDLDSLVRFALVREPILQLILFSLTNVAWCSTLVSLLY